MQPLSATPKAGICYISFFMSSSCVCCQRWARHSLEECPLYNHLFISVSQCLWDRFIEGLLGKQHHFSKQKVLSRHKTVDIFALWCYTVS